MSSPLTARSPLPAAGRGKVWFRASNGAYVQMPVAAKAKALAKQRGDGVEMPQTDPHGLPLPNAAEDEVERALVAEMKHGKGAFVAASSSELSDAERRKILGKLARQLVVEAKQLGASKELVEIVFREAWDQLPS